MRIGGRWFEWVATSIGVLAIATSFFALYLQLSSHPYEPLYDVRVDFLVEEVAPLERAPLQLSGCSDSATTVTIYGIWLGGPAAQLGPATGFELQPGCYSQELALTIPPLPAGEWQLSLLMLASGGGRTPQTLSTISNIIEVTDGE